MTQPRLRKQNYIKYVDRSAIDKDLFILKKALANKIPLNEDANWELPYIIERYKRANVDILSLVQMEDRIIYTLLCYVEMLILQFTCEYTIQVVTFKCLFNFNFKRENVWSLGKVGSTILSAVFTA